MTEIRINNPVQDQFSMVPNVLWTWPGLSLKAKALMAFLLSFRGGVCPEVAQIEAVLGIGRDARKAAMRELMEAKLADWHVERDHLGRVTHKWLEVTTLPMLETVARDARARSDRSRLHATENPSDGKTGGVRRQIRRAPTGNPAILRETERDIDRASPLPQGSSGGARAVSLAETARVDRVAVSAVLVEEAGEAGIADPASLNPHAPLALTPAERAGWQAVCALPRGERVRWLASLGRDAEEIDARLPPAGWPALHGYSLRVVADLVSGRWPVAL